MNLIENIEQFDTNNFEKIFFGELVKRSPSDFVGLIRAIYDNFETLVADADVLVFPMRSAIPFANIMEVIAEEKGVKLPHFIFLLVGTSTDLESGKKVSSIEDSIIGRLVKRQIIDGYINNPSIEKSNHPLRIRVIDEAVTGSRILDIVKSMGDTLRQQLLDKSAELEIVAIKENRILKKTHPLYGPLVAQDAIREIQAPLVFTDWNNSLDKQVWTVNSEEEVILSHTIKNTIATNTTKILTEIFLLARHLPSTIDAINSRKRTILTRLNKINCKEVIVKAFEHFIEEFVEESKTKLTL